MRLVARGANLRELQSVVVVAPGGVEFMDVSLDHPDATRGGL
jgi:hypothetical protein